MHHPTYHLLLTFVSQGGDASMGGKRCGTGIAPMCQPSRRRTPAAAEDPPAFAILHHYVSSYKPRQQEFSAASLNRK